MDLPGGGEPPYKYRAFISYSRADRAAAVRLQRTLERYVLRDAGEILGEGATARPFPRVFRDEDELVPGQDLSKRIRDGLENSEYLIVVCSPAAARSRWVEREIVGFVTLRGYERVLAVVVDGEPHAAEQGQPLEAEALPAGLQFLVRDGVLTDEPSQDLLWIDWRGRLKDDRVNFLRLVAALLSLTSLDELIRRDQQRERRARRSQRLITAGVSILAVVATIGGIGAYQERQVALKAQSTTLAEEALRQSGGGDNPTAMFLALEALPAGQGIAFPRPVTAIAERALIGAANVNRVRAVFHFGGPVETVRFNPSGSQFVTSSDDGTATVFDVKTQQAVVTLRVGGRVMEAVFDPAGNRVAVASTSGEASVWDWRTGKRIATLSGHKFAVRTIEFNPDGKTLLTASSDGTDRLWDAATGKSLAVFGALDNAYRRALFDPDGSATLSAGTDGELHLWSTTTYRSIRTFHVGPHQLQSFRFGADGKSIVTAHNDKTARVWNAATGALVATITAPDDIDDAVINRSGTRVVTLPAEIGDPMVWDTKTNQSIASLSGHNARAMNAWFGPAGDTILTTSFDGTARLWDTELGTQLAMFGHDNGFIVNSAQLSRDGQWVVLGTAGGTVLLCDARISRPASTLESHQKGINTLAYSADGTRIVTASDDMTAIIWDVRTGQPIKPLKGHKKPVWVANFSPDGSRVVTGSGDNTAIIWDARTGLPLLPPLTGHINAVRQAEFSPDGAFVLTASSDWQARLWNARTGAPVKTLQHQQIVYQAHFSPNGRYVVTASADATSQLWDRVTNKVSILRQFAEVQDAVFSPDSRLVATAASDGTVRIWNTGDGQLARLLRAHSDESDAVRFDPSGTQLISISNDKTAMLWDVRTGAQLATLQHSDEVNDARYSPDGRLVATIDQSGNLNIWTNRGALVSNMIRSGQDRGQLKFSPDGRQIGVVGGTSTVPIWRVPQPAFAASGATSGQLVDAGCAAVGNIRNFRSAPAFVLSQVNLPDATPPCERPGLLSWAYYRSLLCSAFGGACDRKDESQRPVQPLHKAHD